MKEIFKLWDHQQKAVDRNKEMGFNPMFLFFAVGTGKSGTAITILRHIYNGHKEILPTLILGPIAIVRQWKEEFDNFSRVDQRVIHAITEKGKKRVDKIRKITEMGKGQIIIMNYESLLNKDIFNAIYKWQPQCIIADETHMLKNPKAKRAVKVAAIADRATYKYGLTGTPILKNPIDLFMQFRIIDGGKTFGKNFFVYRSKYFVDKNAGWANKSNNYFPDWQPNSAMFPELSEKIEKISCQAKKEECIDLPSYHTVQRKVVLSTEQEKAYKEMERDFVTFLDSKHEEPRAVIAQLAITKSMKMLQITSGFVLDENGKPFFFKNNPKIAELKQILENIIDDHKVIIWAHFKANHTMIKHLLDDMKIKYVHVDGSVSAKDKTMRIRDFETDDSVRVIVANQAAAGTGVNLKQASYSIYYSKDYSYGKDEQSAARNYRGGSVDLHDEVTRIDLIAENTIDEKVMEVIQGKEDVAKTILDWSKK
jgi:SNF2 family DNA or RNA helicase